MERLRFSADAAFTPRDPLLDGITIAPLTAPFESGCPVQAAIFRVAPGGRIARHRPNNGTQILAVLEGSGQISGADGELHPITAGEAVFWSEGEEHEMQSETGLTALILEAEELRPWRNRP
jgi:quercetin dioxygenase-like cupin family protein